MEKSPTAVLDNVITEHMLGRARTAVTSFGNWVTSCENVFTPPTRLDKTGQSPIYWKLLKTVANSVQTADADPTKQFCRVGVGGVKWV